MADKLSVYNGALLVCGERFLANLEEEREPRRLLDHVWANNGVRTCLEEGIWFFAMRVVQIDYDPSVEPPYGYKRAFQKPDDWVVTASVCSDEYFRVPLTMYADDSGFLYSDLDTIYAQFVSDDITYGNDLSTWPETFREFVEAHFASKIILKLSNSDEELARVMKRRQACLTDAKNKSLMAQPTTFPAQGSWSRARNRFPNRRDGGNTSGSLIG